MTEIEILEHAKSYIDKLANGIDPMTDMPVGEGDAVNNVRVSRCLFYVSEVLGKVIASGDIPTAPKPKKRPFFLTAEQLSRYPYADRAITVSEIADNLNALADAEQCLKMPYTHITGWLIGIGALELCTVEGKSVKRPTARGGELGIATEQRTGRNGDYTVVVYNRAAQQFITDNLEAIEAAAYAEKEQRKEAAKSQGQPWSPEQDARLAELYRAGMSVINIAIELARTPGGIRARLKHLGLISDSTL